MNLEERLNALGTLLHFRVGQFGRFDTEEITVSGTIEIGGKELIVIKKSTDPLFLETEPIQIAEWIADGVREAILRPSDMPTMHIEAD